jgi:hypothetical protein
MSLPLRFVFACSAALFACGPAAAQLPVAPEPHLALDELVKEYKRFGLPLPPANAELVRIQISGKDPGRPYLLGLRTPPAKPGEDSWYRIGSHFYSSVSMPNAFAEVLERGSGALREIEPEYVVDLLFLAIQCRALGWNEFAEVVYARVQEQMVNPVPSVTGGWRIRGPHRSAADELGFAAWQYWRDTVMGAEDRKEVLHYLKEIKPDGNNDIRDLELTVAPRKSKPGTAEFLIDNLTEYWNGKKWSSGWPGEIGRGEEAYWKLAEMGFDAVPALIEHVKDTRFTRCVLWRHTNNPRIPSTQEVRVGQVVGELLNELSGRELSKADLYWPDWIDPDKARQWWEKARKEGEEKWLTAHLESEPDDSIWRGVSPPPPNRVVFRALRVKYPARLGEFYRTVLRKHPDKGSRVLAKEIAASELPRAKKLSLLEEGAEHKALAHRYAAIEALADLDSPTFRKHLIATLKWLPSDPAGDAFWGYPEANIVNIVRRTDDPDCWDALATTARRASVSLRTSMMTRFYYWSPTELKTARRERLRFLLGFLSDGSRDTQTPAGKPLTFPGFSPPVQVCDLAAECLSMELGMWKAVELVSNHGPLWRLPVRAAVAHLAARELDALKK